MFGALQAVYYGNLVDAFLLGVLATMVGRYCWDFQKDRLVIKCFTWFLFAVEVAITILHQRTGSHRFLEKVAPQPKGTLLFPEDALRFALLGVIVLMCQGFLCCQVYVITNRRKSIFFALLLLTLIVTAMYIICGWFLLSITIETLHSMDSIFIRLTASPSPNSTLTLLTIVLDFVIAGILCFSMWGNLKIATTYSAQLRKIMLGVVETSSLTALFALVNICFFTLMPPEDQSHVLWNTALEKVYAICVLAKLNGRRKLQIEMESIRGKSVHNTDDRRPSAAQEVQEKDSVTWRHVFDNRGREDVEAMTAVRVGGATSHFSPLQLKPAVPPRMPYKTVEITQPPVAQYGSTNGWI